MTEEKKLILDKIDTLLNKKRAELLKELPSVHNVEDGIIIRFFTEWDNCQDDSTIKYKKIPNLDNPDESVVFFYIPKDAIFDIKQRFFIGCMTCLNGIIEIVADNKNRLLEGYSKICVNSDNVQGKAFENTYLVITSNRLKWSEKVKEHQMVAQ